MDEHTDFIVTELLSELKEENKRKDAQIKALNKTIIRIIIVAICALLCIVMVCFGYLSQYDYSSEDVLNIEKSAEGTVAFVDSNGNAVGFDEPVTYNGESSIPSNSNTDQIED